MVSIDHFIQLGGVNLTACGVHPTVLRSWLDIVMAIGAVKLSQQGCKD
jgi:hypothetical protein